MAAVAASPPVAERRRRRDRTRWGPDDDGDATAPAAPSETQTSADRAANAPAAPVPPTRRPKRSRWASEETDVKAVVPGLLAPVSLPPSLAGLVDANPQAMLLHRQLGAISQRLSELSAPGNLEVSEEELRSPSPEPQYNELGVRVNTRAHRLRQKLTTQAQDIVTELLKISPGFKPPPEFRPAKKQRKVFVPVQQYPGYNFIGLIIGPRGNTQKRMQQESGAKIALRGRGSIKDGRGGRSAFDPSENEELHVLITADTEESLEKASEMVQQLMVPLEEGVNEHKRMQLRELAELNGTLRESELQELHGQGRPSDVFQLPPALQEAANRQYDRDVAAVHPQQPHEPMDHAYQEFIQELGSGTAPWNNRPTEHAPGSQQGLRNRDDNSPCNLFVGCIPAGMDELSLRSLFEPSGQIAECHLVLDRISGQHRGFGFVKMAHEQGAHDAIERLHNFVLGGRKLVVRHKHGSQPFSGAVLPSASSLPPGPLANGMDLPALPGSMSMSSEQLPPPPAQQPASNTPDGLPPPPHLAAPGPPHIGQAFYPAPAMSSPSALTSHPLPPAQDRPPGTDTDRPQDAEEPPGAEPTAPQESGAHILGNASHPHALSHADSGGFMQPPMQHVAHGYSFPPYSHPAEHPESLAVAAQHAQVPMPGYAPQEHYSMPHVAEQPYPYAQPFGDAHAAQQHYEAQQQVAEQQQEQDEDLCPPGAEEEDELLPPGYEPVPTEQPQQLPDSYTAQGPDGYAAQTVQQAYSYAAADEDADAHAPGTEDSEMVPPPPPPPPEPPKKAVQVVKVPLPPPSDSPAPAEEPKIVPPTVKLRVPRRVAERAAQQKQKREQQQAAAPPAPASPQEEQPAAAAAAAQPPSPQPAAAPAAAAALPRRSASRTVSPAPPSPQGEPRRSGRGGRKLRRKASLSPSPAPPARSRSPAMKRKAHAPKDKDKDRKRSKRSRKASPARGSSKRRSQRRTASPSATPEDLGELQPAAVLAAKPRQASAAEASTKRGGESRGRAASPRKRRKATRWKADSPPLPAASEVPAEAQPAPVPVEPPRPATPELSEEGEIPMEEGQLPPEEGKARSASPASRRLPSPPRRAQAQHVPPTSPHGFDGRRRASLLAQPQAESPSFARRMDGSRRMSDTGPHRARSPVPGAGSWHRQNSQGSGWSDNKAGAFGQHRGSFDGTAGERNGLPPPPLRRTAGSGSSFAIEQGSRQQQAWGGLQIMTAGHPQQQPQAMLSRGMGSSPYGVYGLLPMADVPVPIMPTPGMVTAPRGPAHWSARY